MKNEFSVVVIGAGCIGSSVLFHVSKRVAKSGSCLLLEKKSGPGQGATGSWGSLIRVLHEDLEITRNACSSLKLFENFADVFGSPCSFNKSGSLYFIKQSDLGRFSQHFDLLRQMGVSFSLIDAVEGKKRFPCFNWYEDDCAIYEPNAGNACPYQTTRIMLRAAESHGAKVQFDEAVTQIREQRDQTLIITTNRNREYIAHNVVVSAGVWSRHVVQSLGIDVPCTIKEIQLNRLCKRHCKTSFPLFVDYSNKSFGHFFPDGSFVGGRMSERLVSDYSDDFHHVSTQEANRAKYVIGSRLNWTKTARLEGGVRALESYSNTGQPFIEFSPMQANVLIATGFGCTGFTLSPLLGERISALLKIA